MELVKSETRAGMAIKRKSEDYSKEDKEEDILEENKVAKDQPKNMTSKDAELNSLFYIPQDFSTQVQSTPNDFHTNFKHLLHIAILTHELCRLILRKGKRLR